MHQRPTYDDLQDSLPDRLKGHSGLAASGRRPHDRPSALPDHADRVLRAGFRWADALRADDARAGTRSGQTGTSMMSTPLNDTRHARTEATIATTWRMLAEILHQERRLVLLELALFNPVQPRVPAGTPDGGQWTDGDSLQATPAMARRHSDNPQDARQRIVIESLKQIDSQMWSDAVRNGRYPENSNKCNLFIYDIMTEAGANPGLPNGIIHSYPPTAAQWADPNYQINGWTALSADEAAEPGDVAAQAIPYSDATGHVMLVGPNNTLIGTGDQGNGPAGTIEQIPMTGNLTNGRIRPSGPVVFRRWRG